MARPPLALATEDFAAYLDLSRHLQAKGIPFESLPPEGPIPGHVEVVITTTPERGRVPHGRVVEYTTPQGTVEEAVSLLKGLDTVRSLVIGIDPGERPGIAVVADGHVLSSRQTSNPERVVEEVQATASRYEGAEVIVRVGHGASTLRDRILNGLLDAGFVVELVDETSTSPPRARVSGERDKVAARSIAMTQGVQVERPRRIDVTPGEIRDIQRRSRIYSEGRVTISKGLADKVATGTMTLAEAVRRQKANRVEP